MMFIKRNDRRPVATATIKRGTTIVDLTLATSVTFKLRLKSRLLTEVVDSAAVITSASGGEVEYRWAVGDTAEAGTYFAEWEVLWSDDTTETFPTVNHDVIVVRADLDGS